MAFTMLKYCLFFLFFMGHFSRTVIACHDSEHRALLQLKKSFLIRKFASSEPSAYPKVQNWKEGSGECCEWDGVECNNNTGHVIGLDLRSSFLYGSIHSNTSLFHLVHLTRLDLSDNHFNGSEIPTGIANLARLTHLDLSFSVLSGQIPSQVLRLSKLVKLNLSWNKELELRSPGRRNLVEKLTNLKVVDLSGVNISNSLVLLQNLGNLTSLVSLYMEECSLHGELPPTIFKLPNLQVLDMRDNPFLTGKLPEFNTSSLIEEMTLSNTSFYGEIPESIGTLNSLLYFDVSSCYFSGLLPSSLGELTKLKHMNLFDNQFSGEIPSFLANFTQLTELSLSDNSFSPGTLSWLGKQTKLTKLALAGANLHGEIPSSVGNLTRLTWLSFYDNHLMSPIPICLGNLTQLSALDLSQNKLQGQIPQSVFSLVNLTILFLDLNDLNGTLNFESFLNLKNLLELQLDDNHLSVVITNITNNGTVPKFRNLSLNFCNITEFPDFLRQQDELEMLQLAGNKIHGQIPNWVWEMSKESLSILTLYGNFLTGFDQPIFSMPNLRFLSLDSNKLHGTIPIPSPSIFSYTVSNNSLTGEFSPLLCNLSSLAFLDLSNNNLSGMLPKCLADLSESLVVLNLRNNSFVGYIPQLCTKGSQLRMIDFSQNQFVGQLPKSSARCDKLESLNVGNNQLNDIFPFWLGKLPELRMLILRHNQFHGTIQEEMSGYLEFSKLQIIDLSFNRFTGNLLSWNFQNWIAMQLVNASGLSYMQANSEFRTQMGLWNKYFMYSITITSKGTERDYEKIQDFLVAIDLSSNSFEGCIPEKVGTLKAIELLNLSHNAFSCHIPLSLGNLSNLESLDLSHNNLSGEIPKELVQLTFLEFFNISFNNITGQIPQGKQFATFGSNSFGSNPGLCGKPLSKTTCTGFQVAPAQSYSEEDEGRETLVEFDWKIIVMGFGSGVVIGVSIGYIYTPEWLMRRKAWRN